MILEGAINFSENNNRTIYTMNSNQTGQYCTVIPKNTELELSIIVDINMKNIFDSLINNTITKEQLVEQINEEYKYIQSSYPNGILVLPMTDINILTNAIMSNDKQKMFDETKKIGAITSEIYKKLTNAGIEKNKINQKIIIVEKTANDIKFVEWLKTQMPNFVDGVAFESLKTKINEATNPFTSVNPFTGESNIESEPQSSATNDIFGTPQTSTESASVVPEKPIENTIQPNDNFSNQISVMEQSVPNTENNQQPIEPQAVQNMNLPNPSTESQNLQEMTPSSTPEIIESETNSEFNNTDIDKKSGGFANLLILLVILIGVTVASIELGKFLYNTFGA